jgi:outer membrane cobalamin receptor
MNFNPHWGMKVLYGEAFRSPDNVETDANIPVINLFGNPDLKPEMITTVDVQTFYHQENAQLALTYFYSRQEDLSVRVRDPTADDASLGFGTFRNEGSLTIEGLELEGKIALLENWFITGGLTYQQNRDADGVEDYTREPHWEWQTRYWLHLACLQYRNL